VCQMRPVCARTESSNEKPRYAELQPSSNCRDEPNSGLANAVETDAQPCRQPDEPVRGFILASGEEDKHRAQGGYDAYFGACSIDDVGHSSVIRLETGTADRTAVTRTLILRRVG
jgi:hypothetical protein